MSKPGGGTSSGISSGDVLILPERHPACRRREARPGSGTERENLAGDAKGKGASGSHREAESTDVPERGGPPRSSDETAVMAVERRGRVTAVASGQPATGRTRHSTEGGSLHAVARAGLPTFLQVLFFVAFSRFFSLSFWRPEPKSRRGLSQASAVNCDRTWHSSSPARDPENQAAAFRLSANEPSNSVLLSSMAQAT